MKLEELMQLYEDCTLSKAIDLEHTYFYLLMDIAQAAKQDALSWDESYCNHEESEQRTAAWTKLHRAIDALEAAP